ncbi:PREDICTED: protein jim lovell-like isoform X10 [Polistes canadensis]|uniref:protein jim lovell-like isoform X10 n=1 Tax=Polistes canadensis TaxID=91411 RepID=UPI000718D808|nr:PREDICTED: protein jim lovell-like isoform X10 [Polistes canadensis]
MDDDQQFCLKWNNHQSTLIQNFDTLLESGTLVDCTLAAEGKYLKAHRVVLSACSPYFEGLLSEHYDMHPVFILKDVKFKELKAMIDYMYRGEVNISQDQLTALLKAAESLQIKGLSESKTVGSNGNNKSLSRVSKVAPQPRSSPLNISYASAGLTIERNRVPRQASSIGDLPEDSHSPQIPKEHSSSREGSLSPTSKKRRKLRRRSAGEDTSIENHEASNSSDIPQQMGVPALAIAPVADEKTNADPTDSLGRSALMTQLTKPADEMLQMPLENPEPSDNLIEPKSEYMEDQEESVEDLTLDDDMNDLNEIEQDTNRAGPSHDTSQHPAGLATWHVTGDRSNASGVVGSVAGAPGTTDEVFLAAQEAAQAHRDSQGVNKYWLSNTRITRSMRMADESIKKNDVGATTINSTFQCKSCNVIFANEELFKQHESFCIITQETCGVTGTGTGTGTKTKTGTETVAGGGSGGVGISIGVFESGSGGGGDSIGGDSGGECGIDEEFPESVKVIVPSLAYRCPYCETSYAKCGNLKRHLKIGCGRDPNYFRNKQ